MKRSLIVAVAGLMLLGALLLGTPGPGVAAAEPCDGTCRPIDQPRSAPVGIPTPARIDTGEGPGDPVNWWLIAVPALVLIGLAAGGAHVWIARTERLPR